MDSNETPGADVQHMIDHEVDIVMSAVDLVASGGAPSTVVAGLRLTDAVITIVTPLARAQGVVIDPLWGSDEADRGVRVHREGTT